MSWYEIIKFEYKKTMSFQNVESNVAIAAIDFNIESEIATIHFNNYHLQSCSM